MNEKTFVAIDKGYKMPYIVGQFCNKASISISGGPLAQLVEQHTFNVRVDGSSPSRPTILPQVSE